MKHLTAGLCAALAACAAAPEARMAAEPEVAASARDHAQTPNACPPRTDTLYVPPMPQPGFVPAPPSGATVVAPRRLRAALPAYSSASQRCREEGKVTISYCVSPDGAVENAQVLVSSGYARLDNAALAWAARERHTAGTVNGRARRYCGLVAEEEFRAKDEAVNSATL